MSFIGGAVDAYCDYGVRQCLDALAPLAQRPSGVEAGIAWYDVSSRTVGPDHLPVLVRSRMRDAAHRKLTEIRPSALRVLLGVLEQLSS